MLDYIRNFHLSQGNSHRLAKAFLLDYNMNVHHQVLVGKTQFFPIVCLALTISHSLHYLQLPHTLIASELIKYKLNSKVSPPLPVQAFSNLPVLCMKWNIPSPQLFKSSSVLLLLGLGAPLTHHWPRSTALSFTASLHILLIQYFLPSNGCLLVPFFYSISHLTWKNKLTCHLYAGDTTPLLQTSLTLSKSKSAHLSAITFCKTVLVRSNSN